MNIISPAYAWEAVVSIPWDRGFEFFSGSTYDSPDLFGHARMARRIAGLPLDTCREGA